MAREEFLTCRVFIAICLLASSRAASNYSFALFWPHTGVAAELGELYRGLFEPRLREACPAAAHVNLEFEEFPMPESPSLELIETYCNRLSNSTFLFAADGEADSGIGDDSLGDEGRSAWRGMLRAAAPPSLRWHSSVAAPVPPLLHMAPGLALAAAATADVSSASLIVGPPYRATDLAPLFASGGGASSGGGVDWHRLNAEEDNATSVVEKLLHSFRPGRLLVAAAHRQLLRRLLQAAANTSLWGPDQRWLLFDTGLAVHSKPSNSNDTGADSAYSNDADNITAMEFGPYTEELIDSLPTTQHVMLYDLLTVWTEFVRQLTCGNGTFETRTITGLTGQFRLQPDGAVTRENWRLGIYRNLPLRPELVGEFSTDGRFSLTPIRPRDISREAVLRHYRQEPLKVLLVLDDPYVRFKAGMEQRTELPLEDRLEGLSFDLCIRLLRQNLGLTNLSLELLPRATAVNNDAWIRVAGALADGHAEVACSAMTQPTLSLSRQLEASVSLSRAYLSTNLSVLFREVRGDSAESMFQFASTMHLYVWLAALGCAGLLALTMSGLHRRHQDRSQFHAVYTVYAALAELFQGRSRQPPRPSGRFAVSAFRLAALLLLVAFAANFAAQRSLARLKMPISSTLGSLLDQTAYRFGTLANSTYSDYFKDSPFRRMRSIYEQMQRRGGQFPDAAAGRAAMEAGDFALIYDARRNAYWGQLTCDSRLVVFNDIPIELSLALPASSKLLPLLNTELAAAAANKTDSWLEALVQRYFDVPDSDRPLCSEVDSGGLSGFLSRLAPEEPPSLAPRPGALTLRETLGLPLLNLFSCALVLLVAGLEYGFDRCRNRWGRNLVDREDSIRGGSTDRRRSTLVLMQVDESVM